MKFTLGFAVLGLLLAHGAPAIAFEEEKAAIAAPADALPVTFDALERLDVAPERAAVQGWSKTLSLNTEQVIVESIATSPLVSWAKVLNLNSMPGLVAQGATSRRYDFIEHPIYEGMRRGVARSTIVLMC